ncbi:MAG: hypothetical protein OK457_08055 [Thaumarchaeota archaeon]|nr:hypothetical protein [Nitrososphaerota archaeon]
MSKFQRSLFSKKIRVVVTATFVLLLVLPSFLGSPVMRTAAGVSGVTTLCSSLPNGVKPGGIYPARSGAFVEGYDTGNIYFCSGGTSKKIATPPLGGSSPGYFGMGAIKTSSNGLVLVLVSGFLQGLWLCKHATTSGWGSKSAFIKLPAAFCSSQPQTFCDPLGTALDKSLNLYYVDALNGELVECTASSGYQSCTVLPGSSALAGHTPYGLFILGSEFYVVDGSCAGYIWAGTSSSLGIIASLGDLLDGITVSNKNPSHSPHIYVAVSGSCTSTAAHILDFNDMKSLPTPLTSSGDLRGLDTSLQFTSSVSGGAYQTTDTA